MTERISTDRAVQLARERAHEAGDEPLVDMLEQLLHFRQYGRLAVAKHDFCVHYNGGISRMRTLVERSGCEWWQCAEPARTARVQRSHGDVRWLCRAHADEGEAKGYWYDNHPSNRRWKEEDARRREREMKLTAGQPETVP